MPIFVHAIGTSDLQIWNLSSSERLRRQLASIGPTVLIDNPASLPADARVLLVRADYVTEPRTLKCLTNRHDVVLQSPATSEFAAAFVSGALAGAVAALLRRETVTVPAGITAVTPRQLADYDEVLRRAAPPLLEHVSPATRGIVEDRLYGNAYKGITDLVTKWLWPRPAKVMVRLCARWNISPNAVTLTGIALMVLATIQFWRGYFLTGLAAAWLMTYLDTVDGKLARVTVQSSKLGHALDHGVDIVHPPAWYLAWAIALPNSTAIGGVDWLEMFWIMIAAYLAGRGAEGAFHALGNCSIFTWRPFDAYFRLITARRNPCLIILTASTVIGRPDWGYFGVVLWTAATTVVLLVRLIQGIYVRLRGAPLQSWLHDREAAARNSPRAFMTFAGTRSAYGEADAPFTVR